MQNVAIQHRRKCGCVDILLSSGCESSFLQTLTGTFSNTIKLNKALFLCKKIEKYTVTTRKCD